MQLGEGFNQAAGFEDWWTEFGYKMATSYTLPSNAAKNLAEFAWREGRCRELSRCSQKVTSNGGT